MSELEQVREHEPVVEKLISIFKSNQLIVKPGEGDGPDMYSAAYEVVAYLDQLSKERVDNLLRSLSFWIEQNTGASEDLTKVTMRIMTLRADLDKKGRQ